MNGKSFIPFAAAIILSTSVLPATAGGYVGLEVSNHGVSLGFGASNWGIWGSSWNSGGASAGFSATLSGYGDWIHVDGLGRVWQPWVAAGWQPYTHGRWMWTSMGWTWVAYEPWGWVPHHYGNWAYSTVGWVWTPGYAYHPGNVVWVSTGVHVGWYPCAPRGWSHSYRGYHHGWHDGYANGHHNGYSRGYEDGWRDARYATWVPRSRVTAENVSHHAVRHDVATHSVARSSVTTMAGAPTRTQVEGYVGRPVPESRIVERTATVDGRKVRMARPEGQGQTVQRHGASTVERALNPEARRRVSSGGATPVQRQSAVEPKANRQPRASSGPSETRRSTNDLRHSSNARSTTRSTGRKSANTAPALPSESVSQPRQGRTAAVSADSQRSADRQHTTNVRTRQTRGSQAATTRTGSATRAAPVRPAKPVAQRQRAAGAKPEATTTPDTRHQSRRKKVEPATTKQPKRNRSRN
jgi:Family of unknown function (DUF6600)